VDALTFTQSGDTGGLPLLGGGGGLLADLKVGGLPLVVFLRGLLLALTFHCSG